MLVVCHHTSPATWLGLAALTDKRLRVYAYRHPVASPPPERRRGRDAEPVGPAFTLSCYAYAAPGERDFAGSPVLELHSLQWVPEAPEEMWEACRALYNRLLKALEAYRPDLMVVPGVYLQPGGFEPVGPTCDMGPEEFASHAAPWLKAVPADAPAAPEEDTDAA
jgi:hypothetical protein